MNGLHEEDMVGPVVQCLLRDCELLATIRLRVELQKCSREYRDTIIAACEKLSGQLRRQNASIERIEAMVAMGQLHFRQHDSQVEC